MADNYLEKKMDDYRRGANSTSRRSVVSASRSTHDFLMPVQRVALLIANPSLRDDLIAALRQYNHKVAFAATDAREGSRLAQSLGALYIPVTDLASSNSLTFIMDTLENRWNGVDAVITDMRGLAEGICNYINIHNSKRDSTRTILFAETGTREEFLCGKSECNFPVIITPGEEAVDFKALSQTALLLLSPLSRAISSLTVDATKKG